MSGDLLSSRSSLPTNSPNFENSSTGLACDKIAIQRFNAACSCSSTLLPGIFRFLEVGLQILLLVWMKIIFLNLVESVVVQLMEFQAVRLIDMMVVWLLLM